MTAQTRRQPMIGRPSSYTDEIAATICDELARGESLRAICDREDMPAMSTVWRWLAAREDFRAMYARAREEQAECHADAIVAIADEQPQTVRDEKGTERVDSAWVQHQRNRVDARKWIAAKLKPRKYGDRVHHAGEDGGPIEHTFRWQSPSDAAKP